MVTKRLLLSAFITCGMTSFAHAICPLTLSGTYLGDVGIDYFSSTDQNSSRYARHTNVQVKWVFTTTVRNGTTTNGTWTAYNQAGGSGSKTGGSNTICQGSYPTSDGETWLFSITDSGAEIQAMMQSWTNDSVLPHASQGRFRKP